MRPRGAWKVRIQMRRAVSPSSRSSRSRISFAARFVNVIARISFGFTPTAVIRCATRCVSTRVLPEPAPAITSSGPSVCSTASRWAGFRFERYCSGEATGTRSMLAGTSNDPLSGGEEVGEREALAEHALADAAGDAAVEAGTRMDERVELAVLPAGVDAGGQGPEEPGVVLAAGKRGVEPSRIDADDVCLEAVVG